MINFVEVTKNYGNNHSDVLKNINMTIPKGNIVVLIGPSGCGKTTMLKMINRLVSTSSGNILINGINNKDYDPITLRRSMGYVIQQIGLFPHMTVRENIEIISKLEKRSINEINYRTIELMNMVGLDPEEYLDRYPTQLSGGQLQRIGVARAFARDPEIILMDEPFSAVDPITRSQLQDELLFLQSKVNKTVVFVTHDMDEAMKLADLICILNEGAIVQYDTPEQIMRNPANDYVSQFVGKHRIWDNPSYIKASDIMLTDVFAVPERLRTVKALQLMTEKHVNSALVVNNRRVFKGYVLAADIQHLSNRSDMVIEVAKMPKGIASPESNLLDLLQMIKENEVSVVPVVDENGILRGIITNSILVTAMSRHYMEEVENEQHN